MDKMTIAVDRNKCKQCGVCFKMMKGYCITQKDGFPVFDETVCNTCQKCVSICPSQAITVNGVYPKKIDETKQVDSEQIYALFEKRRSTKHFKEKPIPKEIIEKIVSVAKYAPNQNKNLSVLVIDEKQLINEIDKSAIAFVKTMHRILFGFRPVELLIRLFYKDIGTIKRKMELNSFQRVIYENTQVIIIVTGNQKIPVTERSAPYMLATIMYMAESLGIGNCLMDSIHLALRTNRKLRKRLKIEEDVFGVLTLGYSDENIKNIPRGYEVDVRWNI
jgi:nitroreductase/NAD-dependent dihydropyrimidine dehydrogenase PreA subunit